MLYLRYIKKIVFIMKYFDVWGKTMKKGDDGFRKVEIVSGGSERTEIKVTVVDGDMDISPDAVISVCQSIGDGKFFVLDYVSDASNLLD